MAYDSLFSKTPAIFADQYAFTMGAVDFSAQELARKSTSQIFFRQLIGNGFKNAEGNDLKIPYLVVGGLGPFVEWLDNWKFTAEDAAYFASQKMGDVRIYSDVYIDLLQNTPLRISIDAMPEGELAFPDEPLFRLTGPHYQVQMLEAALLNVVTAQTGWATIASQFWLAAQRLTGAAPLFEFGARRTPEWGGLGSSRSSYLAGWSGTSNMYAGRVYGVPTVGTMAHAFVMVRESEIEAFTDWVKNMPHLGVFLVDTYDSEEGVKTAITVCKANDIKLRGIRLDSGDVDYLSRKLRKMLDAAGYKETAIMASDSLSVPAIHQIYQVKEAPLNSFAVGGNYAARRQDMGGTTTAVMKTAQSDGRDLMKISNSPDKATLLGAQDILRYIEKGPDGPRYAGDTIIPYGLDVGEGRLSREIISIPRRSPNGLKPFPRGVEFYCPIVPIMRDGRHLLPEFQAQDARAVLQKARNRFFQSMSRLDPAHKAIISPRLYIAGVEAELLDQQTKRARQHMLNAQRRRQQARFTRQNRQGD